MPEFTAANTPGFQPAIESQEVQVTFSGKGGQDLAVTKGVQIDSAAVDAGNTPTTTLRGGLLMALADDDGLALPYDPDANDGTQIAVGILEKHQDMLTGGVARQRFTQLLIHGLVKEAELIGLDARAKAQLAGRMLFDRTPAASAGELMHPRGVYRKAADYAVTAGDNGLLFIATAAVNFTLPAKANGLAFRFLQTADANLVITGSADLVHKGSAAGDTVTFSTASQKIGSHALVECAYIAAGALKWIVTNLGGTTATVA